MLKILQARLHEYVNRELLDVQAGFRKGRPRDQNANISWIIEKAIKFQRNTLVHFSSVSQACTTLCDPMNRTMPGLPVHHELPEPTQTTSIKLVMPFNHLNLCRPLLLLSLIFPSISIFFNASAL